MRFERRASSLLVRPGSAFGSKIMLGTALNQVASIMGPAAYPPTPKAATGLCLRNTRRASNMAGTNIVKFLNRVAPPLPLSPATRRVSIGKPVGGTSFISIPRSVPTSTTSLSFPRASHSRAMASAGKTCPPVPPPAISNFIAEISATQWRSKRRHYKENKSASTRAVRSLLRNVQQNARAQQHHQQTRSAITDERQRNSFGRHHS